MADAEQPDYTSLTVQLLSAYVANNTVASDELAALIQSTRAALIADTAPSAADMVEHVPAVSIRKSLASREHVLSLIDGRPYKTLKRHLASHGLTPAEYRARYGLPESYPMVAQDYSEQRRAVAQKLGLGQRGTQARAAAAAKAAKPKAEAPAAEVSAAPAKKAAAAAKKPVAAKSKVEAAAPAPRADAEAPKAKRAAKPKATNGAQPAQAADSAAAAQPAKAKAPAKTSRKKLGIKAETTAS